MEIEEPSRRLAIALDLLATAAEQWLAAWVELPGRLRQVIESARGTGSRDRRAERVVRACQGFSKAGLAGFARIVGELEAAERAEPDWDHPGSLYSLVHQLRNLTIHLDPNRITRSASSCRRFLDPTGEHQAGRAVEAVSHAATEGDAARMADALRGLRAEAERLWGAGPVGRSAFAEDVPGGEWLIVSVEDVPEWQASVRKVVEIASRQFRGSAHLEYRECNHAAAARAELAAAARAARQGGPRPLLILDLGIPDGQGEPAGFHTGRDLLVYARERLRVPAVVLTTPHDFLGDHLLAHRFGVADYLLKGVESERALLAAVTRIVTAPQTRRLAISDDGTRVVRIDDVELRLDPVPFAVLSAAASRRWRGSCRPVTLTELQAELRTQFGIECLDIEEAVYKLRRAITDRFLAAGRTIHPAEEVIASDQCGGEFAYRVTGHVVDRESPPTRPTGLCRVLVVEDDIDCWQTPIVELLRRYGYHTEAAGSVAEAAERLQDFRPEIACIDLCLPDRPNAPPRPTAGLDVLRALSEVSPGTVPLLLTALADDDRLRDEVVRFGLGPEDILTKSEGPGPIATGLILRLWRAELQLERRAVLPLPELARLPYLRIRAAGDGTARIEVFGEVWHPTVRERQFLLLLARSPGRSVPKSAIFEALWPSDDLTQDGIDVDNALKSLVRRLRQRIATEWLGSRDAPATRRIARQVLNNDGKDSYMLNARIDWDHSE